MLAEEILKKYYVKNLLPSEEQILEAMIEYAENKCIETFRNTRYQAIDIILEELVRFDEIVLDVIEHRIQNIKWNQVKPELT